MKIIKNILLLLNLGLLSCHSQIAYKINGRVANCEGCKVELARYNKETYREKIIQSAAVKRQQFSLAGTIDEKDFYEVDIVGEKASYPITVYLDSNTLHIIAAFNYSPTRLFRYPIIESNSLIQKELSRYMAMRDSAINTFYNKKRMLTSRFEQAMSGNNYLMNKLADSLNHFDDNFKFYLSSAAEAFAKNHPHSIVSPYVLIDVLNYRSNLLVCQEIYNEFDYALQNSKYGKLFAKRVRGKIKQSRLFLGLVINLHGENVDGRPINLKKIEKSNKIVMVDFWASWCGSCRLEISRDLKPLYKKYHSKGFDIIAVSLDKYRKKWLKAISEDQLPVHHISELKGADGIDEKKYHIKAIPSNFIINQKGVIIAANVDCDSLEKIIDKTCMP